MIYNVVVENIKVPLKHDDNEIVYAAKKILKKSGIGDLVSNISVRKKSIDARKKDNIVLVCSAVGEISCDGQPAFDNLPSGVKVIPIVEEKIEFGSTPMSAPPIIVGFGPAGMFCALELARFGYNPIVFERGGDINERVRLADIFMNGGEFSPDTNIQFGAGGAGTFSDGKLTTRIGDPLCRSVLQTFCELGAPESIMWQAKPHIGTDVLRAIVVNADRRICELGGDVRYNHLVTDIGEKTISVGRDTLEFGALVMAIGHSARDTYKVLENNCFSMIPKAFSVGVRIEHLRDDIDHAMYGDSAEYLPPAEYSLSYRTEDRGVYSFCMCPGGVVVPASSEEMGVVTNGMSYSLRNGNNSNAALAVSVLPDDFGNSINGAMDFQRHLERSAFIAGGSDYSAPVQTVGSFLRGKTNTLGRVFPTYMNGKVRMCDLSGLLPDFVSDMLKIGITQFGRNIKGYDCDDAVLTGIETRTSAPLRILRGEDRRVSNKNCEIYPCGEGAGYAGGIMSAAVDGIKTARAIMAKFSPFK